MSKAFGEFVRLAEYHDAMADLDERSAAVVTDSAVSLAHVHLAAIHNAMGWALLECAEAGSADPLAEFGKLATDWLLARRVGPASDVTMAHVVVGDAS